MTETTLPPGLPTAPNTRPCALCKHFDEKILSSGVAYCHRFMIWRGADEVVVNCSGAERADGEESRYVIHFGKDRL